MVTQIKSALSTCPLDGMIYLIYRISETSGFFMVRRHLVYMVVNKEFIPHQNVATEFLQLNTDIEISSIERAQQFSSGKYNMLELLPVKEGYDDSVLASFVNLCMTHAEHGNEVGFVDFFYSLIELFQYPREQDYKNLIGLFGEVSFLRYVYSTTGIDLSEVWHIEGVASKYDIVTDKGNIEIKSTRSSDALITIKHNQLFNADRNFLATVMLDESPDGITLNQLLSALRCQSSGFRGYSFALNLEKEKRRISPIDAETKRLKAIEFKVYNATAVNPFKQVPENVSNLIYQLDLTDQQEVVLNELLGNAQ